MCSIKTKLVFFNLAFDLVNRSGYKKAEDHVKKSSYRVCPFPGGMKLHLVMQPHGSQGSFRSRS
jgi:hypothetical protein